MSHLTVFIDASRYIRSKYTRQHITTAWNKTGNSHRPCQESTIKRWLNNGADTKNPKFEPWILKWANDDNSSLRLQLMREFHGILSTMIEHEEATAA